MSLRLFALIFSSVALNALAQVVLRKAMLTTGKLDLATQDWLSVGVRLLANPYLLGGLGLYGVSIFVWLAVLSRAEVGVAYPFQSMGYVIAAVVGFLYLGEQLTLARLSGVLLICLGLVLIARTA